MSEMEHLKERIKSEQAKLNDMLNSGESDILSWDKTAEMSIKLDKLIVEYLRLQK